METGIGAISKVSNVSLLSGPIVNHIFEIEKKYLNYDCGISIAAL